MYHLDKKTRSLNYPLIPGRCTWTAHHWRTWNPGRSESSFPSCTG